MTDATTISVHKHAMTCHAVGIGEMRARSESNTNENDDDHEYPASERAGRDVPINERNVHSSHDFWICMGHSQRGETIQLHRLMDLKSAQPKTTIQSRKLRESWPEKQ